MPPLMPGGEVEPGRAEHDDAAAGHVLAAVVADALDDRHGAGVAHGEALAGEAAEERAARAWRRRARCCRRSRSPRRRSGGLGRAHDDGAAGQALADVVVGVALERRTRRRAPARRRSSGRPSPRRRPSIVSVGQARGAVPARDLAREQAADRAVLVSIGRSSRTAALLDRRRAAPRSGPRRSSRQSTGSGAARAAARRARPALVGHDQQRREVDPARLPVVDRVVGHEQVGAADQLLDRRTPSDAMSSRTSSATMNR